jgi:hypothetical protein
MYIRTTIKNNVYSSCLLQYVIDCAKEAFTRYIFSFNQTVNLPDDGHKNERNILL